jgi:hypothetical protein
MFLAGSADPDDPELAEFTLSLLAVAVGVDESPLNRLPRDTIQFTPGPAVTLGQLQIFLVPSVGGFTSFNTHVKQLLLENSGYQSFDGLEPAAVQGRGLTQHSLPFGVLLGHNMLTVASVPLHLAGTGGGEPFGSTLVGFQFRHKPSCDDLIIYTKNGCA